MKVHEQSVELLAQNLDKLEHPTAGILRLVQFAHRSDGVTKLARYIAEALVLRLQSNGILLCNGLTECQKALEDAGWTVTPPKTKRAPKRTAELTGMPA